MTCQCQSVKNIEQDKVFNFTLLDEILSEYNGDASTLIAILQRVQVAYGYLPQEVLKELSVRSHINETKIYGVATFYSQFRMKPIGKHLIMLCQGTACHVNGSAGIEAAIKDILSLEEGEMTEDGLFTYINVACLGCCSLAPVMMIDDQTYAKLNYEKVKEIIKTIKQEEA